MRSYAESLEFIYNLQGAAIDLRLNRVTSALAWFDHPQTRFPSFHIAGTNGKGSTAAMLHSMLCRQGYKVGLYTSPHLHSFTERIRIGHDDITEEEVVSLTEEIDHETTRIGVPLTFFEFVTVMAMLQFARKTVDVAVVEVGLGGRLDATNVIRPLASILTTVALDHQEFLGEDVVSIAREKGGIIKDQVPVICGSLPQAVQAVIQGISQSKNSPVYSFANDFSVVVRENRQFDYFGMDWCIEGLTVNLEGAFQCRNGALALAALEATQNTLTVSPAAIRTGLATVTWPGRLEVISKSPFIVLDGAHNSEGVEALLRELPSLVGDRKVRLLFGCMEDKDWAFMLHALSDVCREIVVTRVPMRRSASPERLAAVVSERVAVRAVADPIEGVTHLFKESVEKGDPVLVAGSLYLLGCVRAALVRMTDKFPKEAANL